MKKFWILAAAGALVFAQNGASGSNAANGKQLFLKDGCYECHGLAAQGGTGPRLAPPAIALAAMSAFVRKGGGGMPPYTAKVLSDAEVADIHAYLETIPAPPRVKDIPLLNQ